MRQRSWMTFRIAICAAAVAVLALPLGASSAAAKDKNLLVLNCFSVSMQQGRSGMLEIGIERWSDDAEAEKLATVLVEKSEDDLLKAVQDIKPRAGFMRYVSGGVGWDIQFARLHPLPEGGRKIIIATDRHVGFREARNDGRSMDYQFTLAEIRLDKKGGMAGEGKLAVATKVTYDKKQKRIEIENYGQEPVRLTEIKVTEDNEKKQ